MFRRVRLRTGAISATRWNDPSVGDDFRLLDDNVRVRTRRFAALRKNRPRTNCDHSYQLSPPRFAKGLWSNVGLVQAVTQLPRGGKRLDLDAVEQRARFGWIERGRLAALHAVRWTTH